MCVSGDDGRFSLEVRPDRGHCMVAELDSVGWGYVLPVFAGEDAVLELLSGETVRVRALRKPGKGPVETADVVFQLQPDPLDHPIWTTRAVTDASGEAEVQAVPAGHLEVTGRAAGLPSVERSYESEGAGVGTLSLVFESGVRILGHVVDAATELGVEGARVGSPELGYAETDSEGSFDLPPTLRTHGLVAVLARHPDYAPSVKYVRMSEGEEELEVTLPLRAPVVVEGSVLNEQGVGVPDVAVRGSGYFQDAFFTSERQVETARTDAHGRYRLGSLHPATLYRIEANLDPSCGLQIFRTPGVPGRVEVDPILLAAPGSLSGIVVLGEEDGDPPRIVLALFVPPTLSDSNYIPVGQSLVGPGGRFAFHDLCAGAYSVSLRRGSGGGSTSDSQIFELPVGGLVDDIVFDSGEDRMGSISGRVIGPDGKSPSYRLPVSLLRDGVPILRDSTDGDGGFRFRAQGAGPWALRVEDPQATYAPKEVGPVGASEEPLTIALELLHTPFLLDGYLRDSTGQPVSDVYVAVSDPHTGRRYGKLGIPDERGYFQIDNLKDMAYVVDTVDFQGAYEPVHLPEVHSGETIEIVLQGKP